MRILEFPGRETRKFGSKKADRGNGTSRDKDPQLNLFSAARILPLHPLSPFDKALKMDENGNIKAAKKLYKKAIDAGDMTSDAYCNLGILESQEGNVVKAIDYLTLSLGHNPRHLEAHFNLANLYIEAGNSELGMLHYRLSIEIEPSFSSSYFNLGLCLAELNRYKEAVKVLKEYCRHVTLPERKSALELIGKLERLIREQLAVNS